MVATVVTSPTISTEDSLLGSRSSRFINAPFFGRHPSLRLLRNKSGAEYDFEDSGKKKQPQRKSKKVHRRVRFEVDENDEVKQTVYTYEKIPALVAKHLYTSKKHTKERKRQCKEEATDYASQHQECVESIEVLLDTPLKRADDPVSDLSKAEAVSIIAQSESRGLEIRMVRLVLRHQRWAIRSILSRYWQLRDDGVTEPEVILQARCRQVNRCTTEYALLMARADEKVAMQIYAES